jgi:hypothetical protein
LLDRAISCEGARDAQRLLPDHGQDHRAGPVTVARPKLRGTTERFASQLFGTSVTKTNALEALMIAGFGEDRGPATSKPR